MSKRCWEQETWAPLYVFACADLREREGDDFKRKISDASASSSINVTSRKLRKCESWIKSFWVGLAGGVLLKEGGKKGSPSSDQMPTNKWSKEKKKGNEAKGEKD